jgi:glycine cleavage system regulatory protein
MFAIVVFFFSLSPLPSYNPELRHSQTALIRARIHHQQSLQSVLADSKPKAAGAISQSAELFNESEMTVLSLAGERRKETESNEKQMRVTLLLRFKDPIAESSSRNCR